MLMKSWPPHATTYRLWFRIILFNLVANKSKTHVFSRRVFGIKRKEIMSENKSFHRIFLSLKQRFWQEFLCHHHFNVLRVTSRRLELVANANWHNTIRLKKFLTSQFVLFPYSLKIVLKNHHYNSMRLTLLNLITPHMHRLFTLTAETGNVQRP